MQSSTNPMTNFECVGYFHQVFGHPKYDTLQTNVLTENPKLVQLRINLICEEVRELEEAIRDNDMVEVIDALGDILYVVYGAGHAFGINLDHVFKYAHANNKSVLCPIMPMTKHATYTPGSNFQYCCRLREAMGYRAQPCFQKNIVLENPELVYMHFGFIRSNYLRFKIACSTNNIVEVINSLGDLLFATYSMGHSIGVNLDAAFKIVHESNMTKVCRTEQEALDTIEHYKTLQGFETTNVGYRPSASGPYYAMYNRDTGKILKSKYFSEPDFTQIM